jgi:hypothetical protein
MRTHGIILLMTAAILGATAVPAQAASVAAICPAFDQVALSKLPQRWKDADVTFADAWRKWASTRSAASVRTTAGSNADFRMTSFDGFVGKPREYEVRGQRSNDQRRASARSRSAAGPFGRWTKWSSVILTNAASARIDALIEGRCLWGAPRYIPPELPVAGNQVATRFDGPTTFFEVHRGAQQWGGIQASWVLGPPGELRAVLMKAAFHHPEYLDKDVVGSGMLTRSP